MEAPGFEVLFPCRVVRIGVRFDLDMPLYWRVAFVKQDYLSLRPIFSFFFGSKYSIPDASGLKVLRFNPFGALIWMPSYRPLP